MVMVGIKKFASLLMVLILFTPSIVKIEHHHDHFVCHAQNEKHIHTFHEKCLVCDFEFSTWVLTKIEIIPTKLTLKFCDLFFSYQFSYSGFLNYSFLLRAPPVFTN